MTVRSPSAEASASAPLVTDLDLLSEEESRAIRDTVHALRPQWRRRREEAPFYSLGAASYMDAAQRGFADYSAEARRCNEMLESHFGNLYRRLEAVLSEHLAASVGYHDAFARPGFHVFLSDPAFAQPAASLHFDRQYEHLDWSGLGDVDFDRQLSYTLAVSLPAAGAGLLVWNVNDLDLRHLDDEEKKAVMRRNRMPVLHRYRVGGLALHSGHQLHQIAPMKQMRPEDERITLQGHALIVRGSWILYW